MSAEEWEEDDVAEQAAALKLERRPGSTSGARAVPQAQRIFPDLESWVGGWFVKAFAAHPGTNRRWCARWWDHPEAIHRLEDLWRSWEALRLVEGLGMSTWLREHLDPQRDRLMADSGPFMSCDREQHNPPAPLPVKAAPPGFWQRRASRS